MTSCLPRGTHSLSFLNVDFLFVFRRASTSDKTSSIYASPSHVTGECSLSRSALEASENMRFFITLKPILSQTVCDFSRKAAIHLFPRSRRCSDASPSDPEAGDCAWQAPTNLQRRSFKVTFGRLKESKLCAPVPSIRTTRSPNALFKRYCGTCRRLHPILNHIPPHLCRLPTCGPPKSRTTTPRRTPAPPGKCADTTPL